MLKRRKKSGISKGGAPKGNLNRLSHGKYAKRSPLVLGKAPRGMQRPISDTRRMMAAVTTAVVELRGKTSLHDISVIGELGEAEVTRRLCWRLWNLNRGKLSVEQELAIRRDATRAAEHRSRCLRLLGLDARPDTENPWDIPAIPAPSADDAPETPDDELDAIPGPDAADAPESRPQRHMKRGAAE